MNELSCSKRIFIGKNTDFKVVWSFHEQAYFVFYKKKYLGIKKYRYGDIASYLN